MRLRNLLAALSGLAFLACSDNNQCRTWDLDGDGLVDRTVCTTSAENDFRRIDNEYDEDGFLIKRTIYEFGNQYQPSVISEFRPDGTHRKVTILGQIQHYDKNGKMINKDQEVQ